MKLNSQGERWVGHLQLIDMTKEGANLASLELKIRREVIE